MIYNKKSIIYLLLLVLFVSFVSASVEDYVDSLTFDVDLGQMNVSDFADLLLDSDSNGVNDTLEFNLSTTGSAGNYIFVVDLEEGDNLISEFVNENLSAIDNVYINFSTNLLSQSQYNYSARIFNASGNLVYRKDKVETSVLGSYERGLNITSIADQNVGNDLLRLTVNLSVTANETKNISIFLFYNGSYISSTKEVALTTPSQSVNIDFDNETLKDTHYNGKFLVDYLSIGNKIYEWDQNTSVYSYEAFAKTSYIKKVTSGVVDTDVNNVSDYLEFNVTINVKHSNTYGLELRLYDLYDNFIENVTKSQSLSTGDQKVQLRINGTDIYASKVDGPYLAKYVKLSNSTGEVDYVYEPNITATYYFDDFEKPPLPDLRLNLTGMYYGAGITNVTLNITNIGDAPAFNIFIDVFDNNTYSNQTVVEFLNINESALIKYVVTNTSNYSVITGIVDLANYIDEGNESNNVNQWSRELISSISVSSISSVFSNASYKIMQFTITNEGETNLDNIQWYFDTNDTGIISSSKNLTLSAQESAFVYIEYNFSGVGTYDVVANVTSGSLRNSTTVEIVVQNATSSLVNISGLEVLSSDGFGELFGFNVTNLANQSMVVNWSLDSGENTVYASDLVSLDVNETVFVFVDYNYSATGDYTVVATATNGSESSSMSIGVDVPDLEVQGLSVLNQSGNKRIFEFFLNNTLPVSLFGVNWTFDTDEIVIDGGSLVNLSSGELLLVFVEYNYSSSGTYNVNVSGFNGSLVDSTNLSVEVD